MKDFVKVIALIIILGGLIFVCARMYGKSENVDEYYDDMEYSDYLGDYIDFEDELEESDTENVETTNENEISNEELENEGIENVE